MNRKIKNIALTTLLLMVTTVCFGSGGGYARLNQWREEVEKTHQINIRLQVRKALNEPWSPFTITYRDLESHIYYAGNGVYSFPSGIIAGREHTVLVSQFLSRHPGLELVTSIPEQCEHKVRNRTYTEILGYDVTFKLKAPTPTPKKKP